MSITTPLTGPVTHQAASRSRAGVGLSVLIGALGWMASGCHRNAQPAFMLPPEADISRQASYSIAPPSFPDGGYPPMMNDTYGGPMYPQSGPMGMNMGMGVQPEFAPMPNYFPDDGPQLMPSPGVELAPPPAPPVSDIEQTSGVYCCRRCEELTNELESMSQRVDELSAMMEAQRLTIESLNAALLRADANIGQIHDDLVWHRGELDRLRLETEEQQQRDVERLREIAEIVDRLSQKP